MVISDKLFFCVNPPWFGSTMLSVQEHRNRLRCCSEHMKNYFSLTPVLVINKLWPVVSFCDSNLEWTKHLSARDQGGSRALLRVSVVLRAWSVLEKSSACRALKEMKQFLSW